MPIESQVCDYGWEAIDFSLKSVDEKYYSLKDLKGNNGTLIMFICNHCPYVKAVSKKIMYEANELKKIGVNSIAIMSNDVETYPEDSFVNMQLFAKENNFQFQYLSWGCQNPARPYQLVDG